MRGDSRSDELTIKEAALVVGGASALAARRRVERALEQHQLPWHWGLVGGRRLKMVYREDLVLWRSTLVEPAEAEAHDDNRSDDTGDDDDTHDDARRDDTAGGHDDRGHGTPPAERASAEEAQERVSAMLRDVQQGAIAEVGRQMQPLLERLEHAAERIGRLEAENEGLRRQAEEARRQGDDDRGDDEGQRGQRRPWWRFWSGRRGERIGQRRDISP